MRNYTTKMRNLPLFAIIQKSQRFLVNNPQDIAHDVGHHYRVWEGCMTIVQEEQLSVDSDALQIAAWIHYIDHDKKGQPFLLHLQTAFGLTNELTHRIQQIVREQAYGQTTTMIESAIVSDADRIELLSIPRWQFVFAACQEGIVSKEARDEYIQRVKVRIPNLSHKLHFESTNKLFLEKIAPFELWAERQGVAANQR